MKHFIMRGMMMTENETYKGADFMKSITVIYPDGRHSAYKAAAEKFRELAKAVAGLDCTLIPDSSVNFENLTFSDKIVLIGSDAVNSVVAHLYLKGLADCNNIRTGSDEYAIKTFTINGSRLLLLADGRPRAALYAVYRYFELFCGCRWFWDGDRIPKNSLPFEDINLTESPRFQYRGIRYFAHRSLHRFQAEHWSFEDWKREIDWLLKKRLNMFMLRIGLDDLFQKAFPDIVSYPKLHEPLREAGEGYDDRTLFWSLQYRGELRKKILDYAFSLDLIHPEDCGTMTHWYSRTPYDFLEKVKPKLLAALEGDTYNEITGKVWDILDDKNLDNYFHLTETHIKEYGKPEIFHTIGLAERHFSEDREENLRLKMYVYHRICAYLKEKYPNAPLLIATWDLWQEYTADEVARLIPHFDKNQAIIFDYTSDTVLDNNFTNWGVVGKFPWIFGMFSAYEPTSDIRGDYDLTNSRLKIAKADDKCLGFVLWPELSHGDIFTQEYLSYNAWEKDTPDIETLVEKFCRDRYVSADNEKMLSVWQKFVPIVKLNHWSSKDYGSDIFFKIFFLAKFPEVLSEENLQRIADAKHYKTDAAEVLFALEDFAETADPMLLRDIFDIARSVLYRYINFGIINVQKLYAEKAEVATLKKAAEDTEKLLNCFTNLLSLHSDFSLYDTLKKTESVTETGRNFEGALKQNAGCIYSRSQIYENSKYLYEPEMKLLFDEVIRCAETGDTLDVKKTEEKAAPFRDYYHNTPLCDMEKQKEKQCLKDVLTDCVKVIETMKF